MKKRTLKKIISLSISICLLVVVAGFLSLLIANDFSFDFTGILNPSEVEDPIVEEPIEEVSVFSFSGEEISNNEDLGSFEPDVVYSFIVPFEDYTYKISPNMVSSSSFDFFVDEGLYNCLGEDEFTDGFTCLKEDEDFTVSYRSMYSIVKVLYPDNEISFPLDDTGKYYSFKIVFSDTESNDSLVATFNVFVSEVYDIELDSSELYF